MIKEKIKTIIDKGVKKVKNNLKTILKLKKIKLLGFLLILSIIGIYFFNMADYEYCFEQPYINSETFNNTTYNMIINVEYCTKNEFIAGQQHPIKIKAQIFPYQNDNFLFNEIKKKKFNF